MLKVSRTALPRSRTPSKKMLPLASKPRMKMLSLAFELPPSPSSTVTPGVLRSASCSVVAFCSSITCSLMTEIVCGVSSTGLVNLGDDSFSGL